MTRTTRLGANSEHFRQMAKKHAQEAASTLLPRVRERCLEAERSFLVMAERADVVERDRVERTAAVIPKVGVLRRRRFG